MEDLIHINKTFEKVIYFDKKVNNREFDSCQFKNCDFSNTIFNECVFIDCEFINCNLSLMKLPNSSLKTVQFTECKTLGIRFDECESFLFSVNFTNCILDYSWFNQRKMPKTKFLGCSMKEVNFSNVDLTGSQFSECNLVGSVFDKTILVSADFTTALNYSINPENNSIKKAKFSMQGIPGLLEKYDLRIE